MSAQWVSWQEAAILERLGRAVVTLWDDIPERLQNEILRDATRAPDCAGPPVTRGQLLGLIGASRQGAAPSGASAARPPRGAA